MLNAVYEVGCSYGIAENRICKRINKHLPSPVQILPQGFMVSLFGRPYDCRELSWSGNAPAI